MKLGKLGEWVGAALIKEFVGWLAQNPWVLVGAVGFLINLAGASLPWTLGLTIGSALAVYVGVLVYRYVRRDLMLRQIGLISFSPHAEYERAANWKACSDKIADELPNKIQILGATGWDTFGGGGSPFYSALESFQGELEILLMNPARSENPAMVARAKSLGERDENYIRSIMQTIGRCRELKNGGRRIRVKLYKQVPIWKMIVIHKYLWLQYYRPGVHVDSTPVYGVYADKDRHSLYWPLTQVFAKRWESDGNPEIDLSKPGPGLVLKP